MSKDRRYGVRRCIALKLRKQESAGNKVPTYSPACGLILTYLTWVIGLLHEHPEAVTARYINPQRCVEYSPIHVVW